MKKCVIICIITIGLIFLYILISTYRTEALSRGKDDPPVRVGLGVLTRLTAENPTIFLDAAIDTTKMIARDYPMLPAYLAAKFEEVNPERDMMMLTMQKYPGFRGDEERVMRQKGYPEKLGAVRRDIAKLMGEKYPGLSEKIEADVFDYVDSRYPELSSQLVELRSSQGGNRFSSEMELICSVHPELLPEVLELIRDRHGERVHEVVKDVLTLLQEKHPGLLTDIRSDMFTMMSGKYPGMLRDIKEIQVRRVLGITMDLDREHPGFTRDLEKLLRDKYPSLVIGIEQVYALHEPGREKGHVEKDGMLEPFCKEEHSLFMTSLLLWGEMQGALRLIR